MGLGLGCEMWGRGGDGAGWRVRFWVCGDGKNGRRGWRDGERSEVGVFFVRYLELVVGFKGFGLSIFHSF